MSKADISDTAPEAAAKPLTEAEKPPENVLFTETDEMAQHRAYFARRCEQAEEVLYAPTTSDDIFHVALEVDVDIDEDICMQTPDPLGCPVYLVSQARRKLVEVNVKRLTLKDRQLFDQAKDKEISEYISQEVLEVASRAGVPQGRLLRMRWILTWKPLNDRKGSHKAKARLVVLGFEDPDMLKGTIATAAPTLSKLGRSLVFQVAANNLWKMHSGDVATAFLRGSAEEAKRNLFVEWGPRIEREVEAPSRSSAETPEGNIWSHERSSTLVRTHR